MAPRKPTAKTTASAAKTAKQTAATEKTAAGKLSEDAPKAVSKPAAKKAAATKKTIATASKDTINNKVPVIKKAPKKAAAAATTTKAPAKTSVAKTTAPTKTAAKKRKAEEAEEAEEDEDEVDDEVEEPQVKAKPSTTDKAATAKKRKAEEDAEDEEPKANSSKRRKGDDESATTTAAVVPPPSPAAKKLKTVKARAVINHPPTRRLDIYVSGEGSQGELGLGPGKGPEHECTTSHLNPYLSAEHVGVVQLAVGGMHCAALTHDNKVLTWGVNDHGTLGRETRWDGGLVDVDDNKSDASSDDADLNPRESTPMAVEFTDLPEGTIFTQVAAGDSCTFALTDEGQVYGWGTFRVSSHFSPLSISPPLTKVFSSQGNEGVIGFSPTTEFQYRPTLIPGLKKVTKLAAGANHVLALCSNGAVFAWGAGEQHQLGRRIIQRSRLNGLVPREFGLPKAMIDIAAGDTHSFAIHKNGKVYTWGLNNYGQTDVATGAGGDEAVILHPTIVTALQDKGKVIGIDGGQFHSIAVTDDHQCLTWGRVDGFQVGIKLDALPAAHLIRDMRGNPKILTMPTAVPGIKAVHGVAGTDYSIAVTREGTAFSWGFGDSYRTGQGTDEDIEVATLMSGEEIVGKKIVWAGAGGQFSMLAGLADLPPVVNGVAR
jgi:regulator of chromosome condensation